MLLNNFTVTNDSYKVFSGINPYRLPLFCVWGLIFTRFTLIYSLAFLEEGSISLVISIIGGLLIGFIGFLPLCFALKHIKNTPSTSALLPMSTLLISLIVSFAFLVIAALAFNKYSHENAVVFVFGEALALSVSAIIYGVKKQHKNS